MDIRFYVADFDKVAKLQFELSGASHTFAAGLSKLHVTGASVEKATGDADTLLYTLKITSKDGLAVVSPHIWITALEIPAPSDPKCTVFLKQGGVTLKAYAPPGAKDPFDVTETVGSPKLAMLRIPELVLTKTKLI